MDFATCLRKTRDFPLPPRAVSYLLPYCLWFFHGKQSPFALGIGSLNLQPCHRAAAHVILPSRAHGSGPHGFLSLDAEEPFLRRNPTPGWCASRARAANLSKWKYNTLCHNKKQRSIWYPDPAAQPIRPPQEETEQGLSSPRSGPAPHPPNIRAGSRWLHRYHHAT